MRIAGNFAVWQIEIVFGKRSGKIGRIMPEK
jgi:hypothetical protein